MAFRIGHNGLVPVCKFPIPTTALLSQFARFRYGLCHTSRTKRLLFSLCIIAIAAVANIMLCWYIALWDLSSVIWYYSVAMFVGLFVATTMIVRSTLRAVYMIAEEDALETSIAFLSPYFPEIALQVAPEILRAAKTYFGDIMSPHDVIVVDGNILEKEYPFPIKLHLILQRDTQEMRSCYVSCRL